MGSLTPKDSEFKLLASFNREGFDLLGQDCLLFSVKEKINDASSGKLFTYNEPIKAQVLFDDNEVRMKGRNVRTEMDDARVAFIKLPDGTIPFDLKDSLLEVQAFYNEDRKYTIKKYFGQTNSLYLKIELVPYRESKSTINEPIKEIDEKVEVDGIIKNKGFLKR